MRSAHAFIPAAGLPRGITECNPIAPPPSRSLAKSPPSLPASDPFDPFDRLRDRLNFLLRDRLNFLLRDRLNFLLRDRLNFLLRDRLNFLLRDPLRVFPHCWYDRPPPVRRLADGPLLTQEGKKLTNKSAPSALRSTLYALRFKLYTRSLYSLQKIHSANRYFLKPRTVALFPFFSIFVCNSNN
jgi:hypothetical protein